MDEIERTLRNLGITGLGAVFVAFFIRVMSRRFTEEATAQKASAGEADVIQLLRAEVERLANINEKLSNKVEELQGEVIKLREENAQLAAKIHELTRQIPPPHVIGTSTG